jgi:hypothetical protein
MLKTHLFIYIFRFVIFQIANSKYCRSWFRFFPTYPARTFRFSIFYLPTYLDVPCVWGYSAYPPAFLVALLSKKEPLRVYPAYLERL